MKKANVIEYVVVALLTTLGLYMMTNGYKQVSFHMEQGKNQPFITNFKHADEIIAAKLPTATPTIDTQSLPVDQTMFEKLYLTNFKYISELSDVTIGKDIDGHITEGKTKSVVKYDYDNTLKLFKLYGTYANMPKLREGFYYEGWLVRKEPFSIVSTGKIVIIDEEMTSVYVTERDLRDHTFFVVTLEHNDENPKPELQILEGEFKEI